MISAGDMLAVIGARLSAVCFSFFAVVLGVTCRAEQATYQNGFVGLSTFCLLRAKNNAEGIIEKDCCVGCSSLY